MRKTATNNAFTQYFHTQQISRDTLLAALKAEGIVTFEDAKAALVIYTAERYGVPFKKGEGCKAGEEIMDTSHAKYKTAQKWANRKIREIFVPPAPKAKPALRVEPTFTPSRAQKNAALALLGLCKGDAKAAAAILKAIAA
jgi:hypothetical protein